MQTQLDPTELKHHQIIYPYEGKTKLRAKLCVTKLENSPVRRPVKATVSIRTDSPEMIEHAKMETMVRAWLKKWTPKRSARDKKERPVEAV